jgi:hypothetical protein
MFTGANAEYEGQASVRLGVVELPKAAERVANKRSSDSLPV